MENVRISFKTSGGRVIGETLPNRKRGSVVIGLVWQAVPDCGVSL